MNLNHSLRVAAWMAALIGAAGSVGLTLYVGRHNASWLLMTLFVGWVLSPFAGFLAADLFARRRLIRFLGMLYGVMPAVAVGSLVIYGVVAFGPRPAKPAAAFLIVPALSWLVLGWRCCWCGIRRG